MQRTILLHETETKAILQDWEELVTATMGSVKLKTVYLKEDLITVLELNCGAIIKPPAPWKLDGLPKNLISKAPPPVTDVIIRTNAETWTWILSKLMPPRI
jgi:hypothetical protein